MANKPTVAFVCIHNSCRSQMAEGWAHSIASDIFTAYSAGTENYPEVKPKAVTVMKEVGVDISAQFPKLLADIPSPVDVLVTMGCGVECPFVACLHREDWGLDDPSGKSLEDFRHTRDLIKSKVKDLAERIQSRKIL